MSYWSVITEYVEPWLDSLDDDTFQQVLAAIELLRQEGPQLGRPFVDSVRASQLHNLKELRTESTGRSEIRILFIFDSKRKAVLLVGGDKSQEWSKWYRRSIDQAKKIYSQHVAIGKM